MRPEHLNEALLTRRRAVCSRLPRAVAALVKAGRAGQLPEATRWILQSRVVFLRKPGTATPRPIRVGEFRRRVIAKRLVHDSRLRLQRLFAQHRQCGVAMPGGADTLVHLRRCMEQAAGRGELPAAAVLDLDLRNAFPSLEWPAVRAAVRAHAPELEQWTAWCHGGPVDIQLPSGEWTVCDRGAEQGDPLGPVYCALTLLGCVAAGRAAVEALGGWVWDAWYMDDGQVLLPPEYADAYLVAFDATLSAAGGTRVAGTDFKSRARLLGEPTACLAVPPGWSAGAVGATCKLDPPGPCGKVLGVHIGGADVDGQFATVAAATGEVCAALEQIGDAPAEMALLRMSANACRVVHLLRAAGPEISDAALASFDESQEQALGAVLGGPLPAISLQRASCSAADGGLGLRRARDLRFPAFVASRVEAKPLAVELCGALPEPWREAVLAHWDASTGAAAQQWLGGLPPGTRGVAQQLLEQGAEAAQERAWRLTGLLPPAGGGGTPSAAARGEALLIAAAGAEDPEHPTGREAEGLQAQLTDLEAGIALEAVVEELRSSGDWSGLKLLEDLRDPGTDHSWLWVLSSASGDALPPRGLPHRSAPAAGGTDPGRACGLRVLRRGDRQGVSARPPLRTGGQHPRPQPGAGRAARAGGPCRRLRRRRTPWLGPITPSSPPC